MNEWDEVWSSNSFLSRTVNRGRKVYNWFFVRMLRKFCDKNTRLAEIGCGTSTTSLTIAPEIHSYVGIDLSETALELSRKLSSTLGVTNASFVKGDCYNLDIKDNQFDVVWSQGLIEHFNNPYQIVAEHIRICKKGGTVIVVTPSKFSYFALWYKLTQMKGFKKYWPWTEQEFYNRAMYEKLMVQVGHGHFKTYALSPWCMGSYVLEIKV